jgi:hypothetical protein
VVRGGSWSQIEARARSGARVIGDKELIRQDPIVPKSVWWLTDGDHIGFRVMRAVDEVDALKGIKSKVTVSSPEE